jgi:hypothetical protein
MNRSPFGRRTGSQAPRKQARAKPVALNIQPFSLDIESSSPPLADPELPDRDLQEWKEQRSYKIPWRQISLMGSLCFGIASFVLPDSVNDSVNWILYGLMAMSFYVWFSGRRAKAKT